MAEPKPVTRNQGRATSADRKSKLSPAQAAKINAMANRLIGK
jgi:hypothetical protein